MKIWNVGDKAKKHGAECTVMAISKNSAAIQYNKTGWLDIVCLLELIPDFSHEEQLVIKEMIELYEAGQGIQDFCETLYLAGYHKQKEDLPKDTSDPTTWEVGDLIQCIVGDEPYISLYSTYRIKDNSEGVIGIIDDEGDSEYYLPTKFIFFSRGDDA